MAAAEDGLLREGADEGAMIVAVELQCESPIDVDGLTLLSGLRPGMPLREQDLREAKRRLERTALFTSVDVEAVDEADGVRVLAVLIRKPVINALRFRGNDTFGATELRRVVRLQEGSPINDALRDYAVQRLREFYAEHGFPSVVVQVDVASLGAGEVDLNFRIEEGPALAVRAVGFVGESGLAVAELEAVVPMKPGDRFARESIEAAEKAVLRALRESKFFEAEVESTWVAEDATHGRLELAVQAGPLFEILFQGNRHFSDVDILEMMDLLERPIITDGTWRELSRRARRAYQGAGFYEARVSTRTLQGDRRTVHFDIEEGPRATIREVRFEGLEAIPVEEVRAAMATQPPRWWPWNAGVLIDDVLDEDLKRLWFLYRRFGYLEAQIVDARREIAEDGTGLVVVVVIEEGEQTRIEAVEHVGFAETGVSIEPGLQKGQPFDSEAMEKERAQLASALFKAGFASARVSAAVAASPSGDPYRVDVRYTAEAGQPHVVGDVFVQNNIDTQAGVILRELPFRKGDRLDPDALLLGQSKVYKLGLFRTVSIRPLADAPAQGSSTPSLVRDIAIDVSERFPGSLQWGFGYNTRDGIRGFAEVGYNNLQGRARRVSLRGVFNFDPSQVRADEYLVNLGFFEPRLLDTRWGTRLNLIAQQASRSVDEFSVQRVALVPALEYPLWQGLTVGFDAQVETASISDVARDVLVFNPRDEGRLVTVASGPYAVYDGRDDPFQPTRGNFASLRMRVAPSLLGSDVPYVKLVAQHAHYFPLLDQVTLIYAGRLGWGYTLRSGDVLPIRERFFLGGRTTVRGFDENSIGPTGAPIYNEDGSVADKGGNPLGGDLLASANLELRFPIAFGLGGAAFVDAGTTYLQERPVDISDVRESSGFGLRYATPVGPIGLDYGFKLDRRAGESLGELHFSIGTIF